MSQQERRQHHRARLRLRVARLRGLEPAAEGAEIWTTNVSAGGMLFHAPATCRPAVGAALSFELSIPPGEGHSSVEGKVRGSGRVVRTSPLPAGGVGVAVQFTRPLALGF